MYQIYFDGAPLYDPRMEELSLREASVHLAVNEAGSLSLVLDSAHPAYGRITRKKGVLELFSDGQTLFRGRVLSDTRDFYNARTVEAEGLLACLNDSAIPPHAFPDDWLKDSAYQSAAAEGNVVAFYLGWLLDTHNAQVEEWQQIHLGSVTVTDPNNYITRSCESWATAWDTVSDKLFGSALGGYLLVRYTQNGTFVDYVDELPLTNTQEIEFGENLLDLTDETDASDTYTAILPVGADGLTLRSLPDGAVNGDLVKEGYIVYSTSGRAKYGNITRIVTWNEVTLADNLRSKAAAELAQAGVKLVETITATAVDLGLTDAEVAQLRVGRNTMVKSAPHGLTAAYPLTTLDLDLLRPEQTQIVLGASVASLSGRTQAAEREATRNLERQETKLEDTQRQLDSIYAETSAQITQVVRNSQEIIFEALEEYARTSDLTQLQETISAQLAVMSDNITINVSSVTKRLENMEGDLQAQIDVISKVFRFTADGFYIGDPNSEILLKQSNDRVSFIDGGLEIAWWANKEFHTSDIAVDNSITIAPFILCRRETANGTHLTLKVGG